MASSDDLHGPRPTPAVVQHLAAQLRRDLAGTNLTRNALRAQLGAVIGATPGGPGDKGFPLWPSGEVALIASHLYSDGDGVPASPVRSRAWFRVALALRDPKALFRHALEALESQEPPSGRLLGEAIWANCPREPNSPNHGERHRLKALLRVLARAEPARARAYGEQLAEWAGEENPLAGDVRYALADTTAELESPAAEAGNAVGDGQQGLRVVRTYTRAHGRESREELEKYQRLHEAPTPLAGVPAPARIREELDGAFPWFSEVTRWVTGEFMARACGDGLFYLPPVLLVGPAGIGKTAYMATLARMAGVVARTVPLGGQADNRDLKGTARAWSSGTPGMPVRLIMQMGRANPIMVLDELDKTGGSDLNGNVHDYLLQVTEPETAGGIYDDFLQGATDLSWVTWVATANFEQAIPGPLLSRFQVFRVGAPEEADYPAIVDRMRRRFAEDFGIALETVPEVTEQDWPSLRAHMISPRAMAGAVRELLKRKLIRRQIGGPGQPGADPGPADGPTPG